MINVSTLKSLLEFKDEDLKKLDIEQLRLIVGVLRYATRVVQRQVNEREPDIVVNSD